MHNKTSLMQDFERIGIDPKGTLWLHMSYKALGPVEGGPEAFIDALIEYMKDGLLVLPSHTWASVNAEQNTYDVVNTATCIGLVPELFRKRPGVHRSLHPTHSMAAYGIEAEAFVSGQTAFDTPCHPDSNYGDLIRRNADVLLIGVDFSRNTLVHCIEEIADVPGRLTESMETLYSIDRNGIKHACPQHRHIGAISENYPRMEGEFFRRNLMQKVRVGSAPTLSFKAADLCETTLDLLKDNIGYFDNLPE